MSVLHLRNLSFIKIINAGEQYLVNNIDGNKTLSVFDDKLHLAMMECACELSDQVHAPIYYQVIDKHCQCGFVYVKEEENRWIVYNNSHSFSII